MDLKTIITDLEKFSREHLQIQEFGFGETSNISTKESKYPMLWVSPTGASIDGDMMVVNLDMYVLDIQKMDRSNALTIINKNLMIGKDIVSEFFNKDDAEWTLDEDNVEFTPFSNDFDDNLTGWVVNADIEFESSLADCQIPMEDE